MMDRKPLVDTRFVMKLSPMGGDPSYARAVARMQGLTYASRGHLIAINDEYVARRMREHKDTLVLPDLRVRCLLCMAVATLTNWYTYCTAGPIDEAGLAEVLFHHPHRNYRWLQACDGEQQAKNVLNMLATMCE